MKVYLPGTHLGRFETINYPYFGDISIDYTCLDRESSGPALLKALRPELLASPAAQDHFAESGAAWVDLGEHPHIVRCYEVLKLENIKETLLVLQTVIPDKERDTPTLAAWLGRGQPLPVIQSLLFALQIARGMRFVADKISGFVHGDLKPENVIVGGGRLSQADVNRLRVTNLGLASVLKVQDINPAKLLGIKETSIAQTQSINGVVGTPLYMPPEQWQGESLSVATDVYALGCLLYKMLVGRNPVVGETTTHMRNAHCAGNLRPLPFLLPSEVRDLTTRCLALKPDERYQTWEQVESAIASAYKEIVYFSAPAPEAANTPTQSERKLEGWFLNAMGVASNETGSINTSVFELALKAGNQDGDRMLIGSATNNLGNVYRMQGDTQRAIDHHKNALTIAGETGDRTLEGSALNGMGMANLQLGNPRQAIQYLEKSLALAREIHDRQGEMAALVNMGSVYQQLGDFHRSIQYFEQELGIARQVGNRRGESVALTNLGGIYSSLGDHRRAVQCQEQALKIKLETGDLYSQIATLNNLANAYRDLGDARQAFDNYNKSLEIALELGDRRGEAFALNNMGATYSNLGNLDEALKYHEQALEIFKEIGDRRSLGDCLTNLGFIYMTLGDTKQAREYCEQAIVIDREVGDMFGLALDSFNMANLLVGQNLFSEALPFAEEAAQIMKKIGHPQKAPQSQELVAMIRSRLDETTLAMPENSTATDTSPHQQILNVRQNNPTLTADMSDEDMAILLQQAELALEQGKPMKFVVQRPGKTQIPAGGGPDPSTMSVEECGSYGEKLLVEGRWPDSERYFLAQLEKGKKNVNLEQQAKAYSSLGNVYCFQGNLDQGMVLYSSALLLAEKIHALALSGMIYNDIGEVYRNQGDYPNAFTHYNKSLEIATKLNNENSLAVIYGNLGIVYKNQGKFDQALRAYEKSLEYSIKQGNERLTANQYGNLGVLYGLMGNYTKAIKMQEKSLEICLRLGCQKTAADAYGNLCSAYMGLGNDSMAKEMCQKALDIMQRIGDQHGIALTNGNLGVLYQRAGDAPHARACYERAITVLERIGDRHSAARNHNNLGLLYHALGQFAQARKHLLKAQALFEMVGDKQSAEQMASSLRRF